MLIKYIIYYDSEPFAINILRNSCREGRVIDEIDVELIRQLQKDCRARHVDIAKKLNVVEGTVRKRIRALLENNIIKTIAYQI